MVATSTMTDNTLTWCESSNGKWFLLQDFCADTIRFNFPVELNGLYVSHDGNQMLAK